MKITALITTAIIALSIFAAAPATAKTTDSMMSGSLRCWMSA